MKTLTGKLRENRKLIIKALWIGAMAAGVYYGGKALLNIPPQSYQVETVEAVYRDVDGDGMYDTLERTCFSRSCFSNGEVLWEKTDRLGREVSREELERRHPGGWEGYTYVTIEEGEKK